MTKFPFLSLRNIEDIKLPDDIKEEESFFCQYCQMGFGAIKGRKYHEFRCALNPIKNGKKKNFPTFTCNDCGFNCRNKSTLTRHQTYDCGVTHFCKKCDRIYSSLTALVNHNRKIHNIHIVCRKSL